MKDISNLPVEDQFAILLSEHLGGMSQFQDDHLVTARAGMTTYGQYKQAVREAITRVRSLEQICTNRDLMLVDIAEFEHLLTDGKDSIDQWESRRTEIKLRSTRAKVMLASKRIAELEVELARFWQQAVTIREHLDTLTPEQRYQYEIEYWEALLMERFILNNGKLDGKIVRDVANMPQDMRVRVLTRFQMPFVELRDEYLNRGQGDGYAGLPLPQNNLTAEKIRRLLTKLPELEG